MDEFRAMLKAGVARRKKLGQNMRSLAAEIGGTQGTISNVVAGRIRPPMRWLIGWSKLFDTQEERDRFIRLGAATKLGPVADRALSSGTTYGAADMESQLAAAHRRIEQLERELAELRARSTDNTAMRELTAMLDPDETNTPADHPRAPAIAGRPRRGH